MDETSYATLKNGLIINKRLLQHSAVSFVINNTIVIQAAKFYNGIPSFEIKIPEDLYVEVFYSDIKGRIPHSLKTLVHFWSIMEEMLSF